MHFRGMRICFILTKGMRCQKENLIFWRYFIMAMWILKGLSLAGIVLTLILLILKTKELKNSTEKDAVTGMTGEELIAFGKKHWIVTAIIGFVANFLDTLGIGSFAPSSAAFKMTKSVDDALVPGTLNVGDTIPVCVEAFLFFGFVRIKISPGLHP